LSEPHPETPAEIITARSYIIALLQRIVSEHLLVSIRLGQDSNSPQRTSTVLQVLPSEGVFLLDDLFPLPSAIEKSSIISVDAHFEGARLRFTAVIESLQQEAGLRLWRVAFPESIEYQQARNDHRIVVSSLDIPVRLFVGEGGVLRGVLQDICVQGIGVCLAEMTGLKRGKFYRCSIDHSEDESVEVEIEPSRVEKVGGLLPLKLGLQLHNMSKHEQWQWQRFAAELERRLLRQH
jgi:c-di-GMP-binding flagellar brake protein YcgR